jgi:hypothetical protein
MRAFPMPDNIKICDELSYWKSLYCILFNILAWTDTVIANLDCTKKDDHIHTGSNFISEEYVVDFEVQFLSNN